jgi:hypothetical protein
MPKNIRWGKGLWGSGNLAREVGPDRPNPCGQAAQPFADNVPIDHAPLLYAIGSKIDNVDGDYRK